MEDERAENTQWCIWSWKRCQIIDRQKLEASLIAHRKYEQVSSWERRDILEVSIAYSGHWGIGKAARWVALLEI